MKIATIIARTLLGLIFAVFGSNAFQHFIPMPPPPEGLAGDYMKALFMSHYFYVVAVTQVVGGLIVLSGRFTALGLTLLAPVIVNILCFHIFLNHEGWQLACAVAAIELFLLWRNRAAFAGLMKP
jgi:putative oxidoreductase